jgi:hypothetical protein
VSPVQFAEQFRDARVGFRFVMRFAPIGLQVGGFDGGRQRGVGILMEKHLLDEFIDAVSDEIFIFLDGIRVQLMG